MNDHRHRMRNNDQDSMAVLFTSQNYTNPSVPHGQPLFGNFHRNPQNSRSTVDSSNPPSTNQPLLTTPVTTSNSGIIVPPTPTFPLIHAPLPAASPPVPNLVPEEPASTSLPLPAASLPTSDLLEEQPTSITSITELTIENVEVQGHHGNLYQFTFCSCFNCHPLTSTKLWSLFFSMVLMISTVCLICFSSMPGRRNLEHLLC